jgi:hypothetical protein
MNEQRYITRAYKYGYKAGVEHGARENVQVDATPFIDKIKKEIKKKCNYESLSYPLECRIKQAIENGAEQGNLTCFNRMVSGVSLHNISQDNATLSS